jgi:hypothetical protein
LESNLAVAQKNRFPDYFYFARVVRFPLKSGRNPTEVPEKKWKKK